MTTFDTASEALLEQKERLAAQSSLLVRQICSLSAREAGIQTEPEIPLKTSSHHVPFSEMIQYLSRKNIELETAKSTARSAEESRRAFLGSMSHEIRTPMNGIIGVAALLDQTEMSDEQRDLLQTLRKSADGFLEFLENLLDFAQCTQDNVDDRRVLFAIDATVLQVVNSYRAAARQKELDFSYEQCCELPSLAEGDAGAVRKIVMALLDHALMSTDKGHIHVVLDDKEKSGYMREASISIEDTGAGIPTSQLPSMLRCSANASRSEATVPFQSGLSLALAWELAKSMKGEIIAASSLGGGSNFRFTFPYRPIFEKQKDSPPTKAPDETIPAVEAPPVRSFSCLVADDHPGNRKIAKITMERLGFTVDLANNGEEAVELAEESVYDIILMDIAMPVMDGIRATQLIRNGEVHRVPIIALTGHALPEVEEECLKAGVDVFQTKPLDLHVLKENISLLVQPEEG